MGFWCLVVVGFRFFVSVVLSWCLLVFVGDVGGFRVVFGCFQVFRVVFGGARRRGNLAET